jgi:transcriptional regulator with XRE-family HTH domain
MPVHDRVRQIIENQGLKRGAVARRLGVSKWWLSARLTGRTQLVADDLPRLAMVLGVSPCAFFEESASVGQDLIASGSDDLGPVGIGPSAAALGESWAEAIFELSPADYERLRLWLRLPGALEGDVDAPPLDGTDSRDVKMP